MKARMEKPSKEPTKQFAIAIIMKNIKTAKGRKLIGTCLDRDPELRRVVQEFIDQKVEPLLK
jgi:hypothetical protein